MARPPSVLVPLLLQIRRAALRVIRTALLRHARARPPGGDGAGDKVFILLVSAWGMGGTIRAAINLANYLADHRDVEIISTYRRRDEPYFPFNVGVEVTSLDDQRPGAVPLWKRPLKYVLSFIPSALYHRADIRKHNHTLWTDVQLIRRLRRRRGIVIGTRPGLNLLAIDLGLPGLATIGVEQMHLASHGRNLRRAMLRRYGRLDALIVLTEQDRQAYAARLDGSAPPIWRIPNTVRNIQTEVADTEVKRILAAGRFVPQKGFDLLIRAFVPVAQAHPDWELRIHGRGPQEPRLRRLIAEHGLADRVTLADPTDDMPGEMARASIYALSSRFEGFPLVLIEAMSMGMGVVAFDCPTGPADMIRNHENGILVPPKDVPGFTSGLMEMIEDGDLRRRCAAAAREAAEQYTMSSVGPLWDEVLASLRDTPVRR